MRMGRLIVSRQRCSRVRVESLCTARLQRPLVSPTRRRRRLQEREKSAVDASTTRRTGRRNRAGVVAANTARVRIIVVERGGFVECCVLLSSASPHIACPVADRRTHAVVDERPTSVCRHEQQRQVKHSGRAQDGLNRVQLNTQTSRPKSQLNVFVVVVWDSSATQPRWGGSSAKVAPPAGAGASIRINGKRLPRLSLLALI
jgi:hypothetical protein